MADVLEDQESLARAILEQDPRSVVTEKEKRINELRKALQEGSPRSATEAMQSRALDQDQIDKANERAIRASKDDKKIDKIGDKGQKQRDDGTEERKRFKIVNEEGTLANDYLRSFDRLDRDIKNTIMDKVGRELSEFWPPAKALLEDPSIDRNKLLEGLLRDPRFAENVKGLLDKAVKEAENTKQIPNEVRERAAQADAAYKELQRDYTEKEKLLKSVHDDKSSFESGGKKAKQLEELDPVETIDIKIKQKKDEITALQKQFREADEDYKEKDKDFKTKKDDATEKAREEAKTKKRESLEKIEDINKAIQQLEQDRITRKALEEEKEKLTKDEARQSRELEELEEKVDAAETKKFQTQADLNMAMYDVEAQEKIYVKRMEEIFKNATQEYMMDRIKEAEGKATEILDKEKDKAKSDSEKGFFNMLQKRWIQEYPTGNGQLKRIENKKDVIQADFNKLMREGPDELMKSILQAQEPSLSSEKIEEMMKDEEFKKDAQAKMLERIVAKRMQVGSLTSGEAEKILDSEWGASLINKAYENNPKMKAQIDDLREKGIVRGKLSEWMRNNKGKTGMIIALLLLLLTGVGFGVAAALPITLT